MKNTATEENTIEVFMPYKPLKKGGRLSQKRKDELEQLANDSLLSQRKFRTIEEYNYYRSYIKERNEVLKKYKKIKKIVNLFQEHFPVIIKTIITIAFIIGTIYMLAYIEPFVSATMQDKTWPVRVQFDGGEILWSTATYKIKDDMMYKTYRPVRIEEGRYEKERTELYMSAHPQR